LATFLTVFIALAIAFIVYKMFIGEQTPQAEEVEKERFSEIWFNWDCC